VNYAGAASKVPLRRKQSRMSVMFNEVHDIPNDDEIGVETDWHDLHGGSFHRLSKKHKDQLTRRLSSMGPVAPRPTDISKYARVAVFSTVEHLLYSSATRLFNKMNHCLPIAFTTFFRHSIGC